MVLSIDKCLYDFLEKTEKPATETILFIAPGKTANMDPTGTIISLIAGAGAASLRHEPPNRKIIPAYLDAIIGGIGGIALAYWAQPYFLAFTLTSYISFALLCAMAGYVLDDLISSITFILKIRKPQLQGKRRQP